MDKPDIRMGSIGTVRSPTDERRIRTAANDPRQRRRDHPGGAGGAAAGSGVVFFFEHQDPNRSDRDDGEEELADFDSCNKAAR